MSFRIPFLRVLALPAMLVALFMAACHLGDEEKVEATISFNQIFDSLVRYDTVLISLKDKDGNTIDVVFHGKVKVPGDVEKLPAPHWDGGKITVSIIGYKDGKIAYRTETGFDGAGNKKDSVYVFVSPALGLTAALTSIPMLEGDSIPLPPITITPENLKVKDLTWVSSAPDVVRIGSTGFKALRAGNAQITIALVADPAKTFIIAVTVVDPTRIPDSLYLSADSLKLSAGGAVGRLDVQFVPSTASKDVRWAIVDTNIATVAADGTVKGIRAGETRLTATSNLKATASDTAVVVVTTPTPPEKVVFAKAETEVFAGGAAESLLVSVLPPLANQDVDFTVPTPLILGIQNGRVNGLAQGEGLVIATSRANPLLADTLKVKVSVKQVVTSLTVSKKALTVFTGGEEPVLTALIEPAATNQKVQWRSGQSGIATVNDAGKVTGVTPGHTTVYAISLVDSAYQDSAKVTVKTDAPVVNIGRPDTTVSVGASVTFLPVVPLQEYGVVVAFRWDVDGVAGWDDTAKVVQGVTVAFTLEKEYTLRFYVRDTEGNETIATKKVSAVVGPVVNIVSPANGTYFNKPALKIVWTIDNAVQTTGNDTVLKDGANIITRSAKDAAGKVFSNSVTVYLDSVPPAKPLVKVPPGNTTGKPTWTWSPGGGGNGTYRIAVDSQNFAGRPEIKDTLYIPETALAEGVHTLYVQERDAAGNWSASGFMATAVDFSGPVKPIVTTNVASPTKEKKPVWSWVTGGGSGSGIFQYKLNSSDFTSGASAPGTAAQFIPATNIGDATYTLYVRERDSLGNWSEAGSAALVIDTTAPGAPVILATSPTSAAPEWAWSSGGGGSGTYRFLVGGQPTTAPEVTVLKHVLPTSAISKTTYILYVQERDAVGNWSPVANASVFYDLSKPTATFTAPQASGLYRTTLAAVNVIGTSTSPAGGGAIKTVTYTVNGVAGTLPTNLAGDGSWRINALPLTNNATLELKVTVTNEANNTGEGTLSILMDNTAPAAPAYTVQPPAIVPKTDTRTSLSWTWNQPAGTDSFVVRLNGSEVARQVGTTYQINSISDGTYQLQVSGKDLTGNASGFTSSTSVLVDRTSPNAPTLSQPASPRRTAQWTWEPGGGGNGTFQCLLDGATSPTTCTTPFNLPSPTDGDHTLRVRELDAAGNPSGYSSTTVTIDLQSPTIARSNYLTISTQIANSFGAFTGTASDDRGLKIVTYNLSSGGSGNATGTSNWTLSPNFATGTHTLTVTVEDQAGNTASTQVKITYQPLVIFVRKEAGGSGNGSSWQNAYTDLAPLLKGDKDYTSGTQFWVAEGAYSAPDESGFILRPNSSVYGGFSSEGTDSSLAVRNTAVNISTLNQWASGSGRIVSNSYDRPGLPLLTFDNILLSDFEFGSAFIGAYISDAKKMTFNKIRADSKSFNMGIFLPGESKVEIVDCIFTSNTVYEGFVYLNSDTYVRVKNTNFNWNTVGSGGGSINIGGGSVCASDKTHVAGINPDDVSVGAWGGTFSYDGSATFGTPIAGSSTKVGSCPAPF